MSKLEKEEERLEKLLKEAIESEDFDSENLKQLKNNFSSVNFVKIK